MLSARQGRAESRRGLMLIMLAAVMWGTVGITTKALYGLSATNPVSVGFFRLALSVPVLFVICWTRLRWNMFAVARSDFVIMLLIGILSATYQVCYFSAVELTGVAMATVVTLCTAPVMVAVISLAVTRQRPSRYTVIALVGSLSGTALLVLFKEQTGPATTDAKGILLALSSALGYSLVTITSKKLANRYDPFQTLCISFSVGTAALLVLAQSHGLSLEYTTASWLLLVYLGTVPTALAYVLFIFGMRTTTATAASISTLLEPLVATLLAWVLFGERFGQMGVLGVALLIGGLLTLYFGGTRQVQEYARKRI